MLSTRVSPEGHLLSLGRCSSGPSICGAERMAASALAVSQWLHGSTARARRPLRQAQGKHLSTAGKMPALQLLVMDFVVAGFAAGAAVVEAVFPEADIELALAEAAVLLAFAPRLGLVALGARRFGVGT